MKDLLNKKCKPCRGGVDLFSHSQANEYLAEVPGWEIIEDDKKIKKEFKFKNFDEAIDFVDKVARVSEEEGHHPDIHIFYNKVVIELWTHAIGGLSENDFILAAKINTATQI